RTHRRRVQRRADGRRICPLVSRRAGCVLGRSESENAMCGITGAAWTDGAAPLELAVLERMTTAIAHRGPDDAGYYHSMLAPSGAGRDLNLLAVPAERASAGGPGAALGSRRLAIIDLAGGHQPLSNEDGTIWIAFNGEIYNYRELQTTLERQGHRFRTSSD